jgi:type I site-specific restriction endonuclease
MVDLARVQHPNSLKSDYILAYKGVKLAVVEAKSNNKDVSDGVAQTTSSHICASSKGGSSD